LESAFSSCSFIFIVLLGLVLPLLLVLGQGVQLLILGLGVDGHFALIDHDALGDIGLGSPLQLWLESAFFHLFLIQDLLGLLSPLFLVSSSSQPLKSRELVFFDLLSNLQSVLASNVFSVLIQLRLVRVAVLVRF